MSAATVEPPGVFPAPPGVTPQYVDPPLNTNGLVPLICVFLSLSTIALILRLYTKAFIIRLFGWEDVVITLAWMCCASMMALYLAGLAVNSATHMWNFTIYNFPKYAKVRTPSFAGIKQGYSMANISKLAPATELMYVPAVALPKISILLFYLRLNPTKSFRNSTYAVMFLTMVYLASLLLVQLFACRPVKKLWEPLIDGTCINEDPVYLVIPIAGTILDIMVLLLPIPMLIKLQVNLRTKLLLGAVFTICSSTVLLSALRIWSTSKIQGTEDLTWNAAVSNCLTVAEVNLMIVCGSILVLRPFCRRHLPFLLSGDRSKITDEMKGRRADGGINFDGPLGPRSKSEYRTKVSGGRSGISGGSKRTAKRGLWGGLGSTTLMNDDDDLESLSAELKTLPSDKQRSTLGGNRSNVQRMAYGVNPSHSDRSLSDDSPHSAGQIGIARSDLGGQYPPIREDEMGNGIIKTVSLDVR